MKQLFPDMYERPDNRTIVGGITHFGMAFIVLPFLLALLMQGSFQNTAILCGVEIFYHAVNFVVTICIFRKYLAEAWFIFPIDRKKILAAAGIALLIILILVFALGFFAWIHGDFLAAFATLSMLPLAETDLFALSSDIVYLSPIPGTICMVLLVPFTTSCLLYATGFAPVCCNRPGLAYLVVILILAVPRCCNAFSLWDFQSELMLFLFQLPIHLLACWAYQKSDNIWAPIFTLSAANLISSLLIVFLLR